MTTVPSPCINWCDIDPESGLCHGCYRTLTEIAGWSELSDSDKLAVLEKLNLRKSQTSE